MSFIGRPGKTAPLFVEDVLLYDPFHSLPSRFNFLTDIPPAYDGVNSFELKSTETCQHKYVYNRHQSRPPPEIGGDGVGNSYNITSTCLHCCLHLDVSVKYVKPRAWQGTHLHHLVYIPNTPAVHNQWREYGQMMQTFNFQCTVSTCSAIFTVKTLTPVLTPQHINMLVDPKRIKARTTDAFEAYPDRMEGVAVPSSAHVLETLSKYIENALTSSELKKIRAITKRFIICFGIRGGPCKEVLEHCGFTFQASEDNWIPPRPNIEAGTSDNLYVYLDNIVSELRTLQWQYESSDIQRASCLASTEAAPEKYVKLLGVSNYRKFVSRTQDGAYLPSKRWQRYYIDLGVKEDMDNSSILYAYHRQLETDPRRTPYYLRCLRNIGSHRSQMDDEEIQKVVVHNEYGNGRYADDDIPSAYNFFFLSQDGNCTEDEIIAAFFASIDNKLDDSEARKQLWRIGESRGSKRIKSIAEERLSTAAQALIFLGAESNTPDDFIASMHTAKVSDDPSQNQMADRALSLIARDRKSDALRHFLETGEMNQPEMDAGDAFNLLQIPDRTVDDAMILSAYSVCVAENPEQTEKYQKALSIIAKDKSSLVLSGELGYNKPLLNDSSNDQGSNQWPVGLGNIGNTCYLNSLLQFYFTIQPFRNMVLNLDETLVPLDEEEILSNKQVGSRKVTYAEIERSQKFLRQLAKLFEDMITSRKSTVIPREELARLTLLSSSNEAVLRRKAKQEASVPISHPGAVDGMPVQGPIGPQATQADRAENKSSEIATASNAVNYSENGMKSDVPPENKGIVDSGASNDQMDLSEKSTDHQTESPSIPPQRQLSEAEYQQQLREELRFGAQQDVTEVINNVLFQAECAVKPFSVEPNGDQHDIIKDLFYGRTNCYIKTDKGTRSQEDIWCDIKVDVASGPKDIYSAIDRAFDAQRVQVGDAYAEQYGAISRLPPILQIQVQRVQFDPIKKTSFKSKNHLHLRESIYMDRYMVSDDSNILDRRRQTWAWKEELSQLEKRRGELIDSENGSRLPDVFQALQTDIRGLRAMKDSNIFADEAVDVDGSLIDDLAELEEISKKEIFSIETQQIELRSSIESQFTDLQHIPYHIYAVFIHSGSSNISGHYYIYIFDFNRRIWRKYNDEYITEVTDISQIFGDNGSATPYFVVYVHEPLIDGLVQPVFRDIDEPAPPSAHPPETNTQTRTHKTKNEPVDQDVDMTSPPAYSEVNNTGGTGYPYHEPHEDRGRLRERHGNFRNGIIVTERELSASSSRNRKRKDNPLRTDNTD